MFLSKRKRKKSSLSVKLLYILACLLWPTTKVKVFQHCQGVCFGVIAFPWWCSRLAGLLLQNCAAWRDYASTFLFTQTNQNLESRPLSLFLRVVCSQSRREAEVAQEEPEAESWADATRGEKAAAVGDHRRKSVVIFFCKGSQTLLQQHLWGSQKTLLLQKHFQ